MRSSVTVKLSGGLGNQLFQYAAGRALAIRQDAGLYLDTRFFSKGRHREFALADFHIAGAIAPSGLGGFLHRAMDGLVSGRAVKFKEHQFTFDSAVLSLAGNVFLDGYFQSEKYFADVAHHIRRELTPIKGFSSSAEALDHEIDQSESISLHIRRGDYVTNPRVNRTHGVLGADYYQNAASLIANRCAGNPTVFVFSDDPVWARNLDIPYRRVMAADYSGLRDVEEMILMSRCKHHIIANSSFSWWGAWLNHRESKIVIAPQPWFADPSFVDRDLVPTDWLRIEAAMESTKL